MDTSFRPGRWPLPLALLTAFFVAGVCAYAPADDSYDLGAVFSFGGFGAPFNSSGPLGPDVANTPALTRITVRGTYNSGGTSWENEMVLRLVGPPGTFNIQLGVASGPTLGIPISVGVGVASAPNANGAWTFEFAETFDDGGPSLPDALLEDCVITFEGPAAPFPAVETFRTYLPTTSAGFQGVRTNTAGVPGSPGWMEARGNVAAPVIFTTAPTSFGSNAAWGQDGFLNSGTTGGISIATNSAVRSEWFISPAFDLGGGSPAFNLRLDLGLTTTGGTGAGTLAADDVLSVLISDVGGTTWTSGGGQLLATYTSATPISNMGQSETIPLAGFTGTRRIGFHFFSSANNSSLDLHLDNMEFVPVVPTLSIGDVTQVEANAGAMSFSFPVTVANPGGTINFQVDTINGTASAARGDFVAIVAGAGSVTGAAGTVSVTVNGDAIPELDETFTVVLSNLSGGALLADGTALGTILDDDFACDAPEEFNSGGGETPPPDWENLELGSSRLLWTFDNPFARPAAPPLAAPFATFDSDQGGVNDGEAEDCVLVTPTFDFSGPEYVRLEWDEIFRAGFGGRQTVEVSIDGGSEWIAVLDNSTVSSGNFATGVPARRVLELSSLAGNEAQVRVRFRWRGDFAWWWIVDNVQFCTGELPPGFSQLSIADAVGQESTGITFTVVATPPAASPLSVEYMVVSGTGPLGAVNEEDFSTPPTGTVSFAMGEPSAPLEIGALDDDERESTKTFTVLLTSVIAGNAVIDDDTAVGTLQNDERLPANVAFGANFLPASSAGFFDLDQSRGMVLGLFPHATITSSRRLVGGDFEGNEFGTFYAADALATPPLLVAVDTTTWATTETEIGGVGPNETAAGLCFDPRGVGSFLMTHEGATPPFVHRLYAIDLQTAQASFIGNVGPGLVRAHGLMCRTSDGQLFTVDTGTDQLVRIDKANANATPAGSTTIAFSDVAGDGDFDDDRGILYYAAIDDTSGMNQLYTIDTVTGRATLVADIESKGGLGQTSALGISSEFVPVELSAFALE